MPDPDTHAAAAHLSNTPLDYSHQDWEQAQREDPLCDATRRYIHLGCPEHSLASLCDHLPPHRRPDPADIRDLAAKGRLIRVPMTQCCLRVNPPHPPLDLTVPRLVSDDPLLTIRRCHRLAPRLCPPPSNAAGSKRVDEVAAGDAVKAFRVGAGGAVAWGSATVAAVVETVPDGGAVMLAII